MILFNIGGKGTATLRNVQEKTRKSNQSGENERKNRNNGWSKFLPADYCLRGGIFIIALPLFAGIGAET